MRIHFHLSDDLDRYDAIVLGVVCFEHTAKGTTINMMSWREREREREDESRQ